jgi:hypothetical protein
VFRYALFTAIVFDFMSLVASMVDLLKEAIEMFAEMADVRDSLPDVTAAELAAFNPWRDLPAGQDDNLREGELQIVMVNVYWTV